MCLCCVMKCHKLLLWTVRINIQISYFDRLKPTGLVLVHFLNFISQCSLLSTLYSTPVSLYCPNKYAKLIPTSGFLHFLFLCLEYTPPNPFHACLSSLLEWQSRCNLSYSLSHQPVIFFTAFTARWNYLFHLFH